MSDMVCAHGNLSRQCETCEMVNEITALKVECERLQNDIPTPEQIRNAVLEEAAKICDELSSELVGLAGAPGITAKECAARIRADERGEK